MADKKGSRDTDSEELKIRKIELKWTFFGKLVDSVLKWGSGVAVAWFVTEAWVRTAGTITIADLSASFKFETITSWTWSLLVFVVIGSVAYGRRQKKLKEDAIERLHPYQEKYEKLIDPNRTSSRLTKRGDTHPEDHE